MLTFGQRYIVQDRFNFQFIGRLGEDLELLPTINRAYHFDNVEDASLNGFSLCPDGFLVFSFYVLVD